MDTKEKILMVAQNLIQSKGFNGFSFADIADSVGIRKASIYHHFPTKVALGIALVEQYSLGLKNLLSNIDSQSQNAADQLKSYVSIYRTNLDSDLMCLGGMLASEAQTLAPELNTHLTYFFDINHSWLSKVLKTGQSNNEIHLNTSADAQASLFLAALQGALLVARAYGQLSSFEQTTDSLISNLLRKG
jgi:TetR/AcrR family transcriptional repressor of nem operon